MRSLSAHPEHPPEQRQVLVRGHAARAIAIEAVELEHQIAGAALAHVVAHAVLAVDPARVVAEMPLVLAARNVAANATSTAHAVVHLDAWPRIVIEATPADPAPALRARR